MAQRVPSGPQGILLVALLASPLSFSLSPPPLQENPSQLTTRLLSQGQGTTPPVPQGQGIGESECGQQLEKGEADMENLLQVLGSSKHKRDNQTRACGLGATLRSPHADCEGGDDFSGAECPVCLGGT